MIKNLIKNWRISLAILIMAVFVNWQIIDAATTSDSSKYGRDNYNKVSDAIVAYHKNVNQIFNDKIKLLVSGDGVMDFDENCPAANASTYCLAQEVVSEYIEFQKGLDDHMLYAVDAGDDLLYISSVTEQAKARYTMIEVERGYAMEIMDLALAAYNELQIAYPLHHKYEEIIDSLDTYNSKLAKWRDSASEWPSDFIDVSTTECT